jgi:hypothetical protein
MSTEQKLNPLQAAALNRKLAEAEIVSRAWADSSFRQQLEADPRAAFEAAGFPLPAGTSVAINTEAANTISIVLPPKPSFPSELDEQELSAVAGGSPGSIETGRCEMMETSKEVLNKGGNNGIFGLIGVVATAAAGVTGYSWAWQ